MKNRLYHPPKWHHFSAHHHKQADWLELFYDLIYVAAFIQLGNGISENLNLMGVFKFILMFSALWSTWACFTFYSNRFNADDFIHRLIVFIHMFGVGAMAITASNVFAGDYQLFALSYFSSQIMIGVMYIRAIAESKENIDYSIFWGSGIFFASVLWLASAFFEEFSLWIWPVAVAGLLSLPFSQKSRRLHSKYPLDQHHLSERFGLLTIIVLGESFVKVISELASRPDSSDLILQACYVLLITCSVWWIYFDDVAKSDLKKTKNAFVLWFLAHIPLQGSIIVLGVAVKKATLLEPFGPMSSKIAWMLSLSLGCAFLANALIDIVTERKNSQLLEKGRVNVRAFSGLFLILFALTATKIPALYYSLIILLVCLFQIAFDLVFEPEVMGAHESVEDFKPIHKQVEERKTGKSTANSNLNIDDPLILGLPNNFKKDLYFYFMEGSWTNLIIFILFAYLIMNLFFGSIFMIIPGSLSGSDGTFADAFFFSVQTMSTIGYGSLSPGNTFSNLIVTIEAALSIISVALVTGLVFAKISKPSAKVLFTRNMVINSMDGKQILQFRLGNTRGNDFIDAKVHVTALFDYKTAEGEHFRVLKPLKLRRESTPLFKLTWTLFHELDDSPLKEMAEKNDFSDLVALNVIVTGHDSTYGNTIYSRNIYHPQDIVFDHRFRDILRTTEANRMVVDYQNFHAIDPIG